MAAELVGGAFLSAFLQVAFDRLASHQVFDFFRGRKLDKELPKRLQQTLRFIDPLVVDAELKQFSDESVKAWLDDIRDAVHDAEDLLDDIDIQVTESKLEDEAESESQTCTCNYKVWNFFKAPSFSSFDKEVESRMKKVLEELDFLENKKDNLGLKNAIGVGVVSSSKVSSTSLVAENDTVIYGRDDDKETIFNWLTSPTKNGKQLSIISIVGMGGLGKTTLAQHVYNDPRTEVEGKFDIKAWVCVSDDFDVFKLTTAILRAITGSKEDSEDQDMVCRRLKENLTGKRFLLVLDDVWNDKRHQWEAVQTPLDYGAQGSKILVTTRNYEVALCMRSNETHLLKHLQEEHCWNVLAKHAFNDENPQPNPELKKIGLQIVGKCKGLPLALKTIGGLLYRKSSVLEWESVLKSEIWNLPKQHNDIIPALLLSYHHLPSPLKRCFAFCALFPKDYEFDKEHLILLWMAENFLQCLQQNKSEEEVGSQYFDDLLSRSFFQQSSEDTMRYVMHDLLNDLAKYVCGDIYFRLEVKEAQSIPEKTRHFSLATNCIDNFEGFKGLFDPSKLRTFLPLSWSPWDGWMSIMSMHALFSKFRFVHVLSLSKCESLTEVPDLVCNLKHLRSLDLSGTKIEKLPDSLCFLFNLQILKLQSCQSLKELPLYLHKLTKLCHLDIRGTQLRKLPTNLGNLKNLQVLMSSFCVDKIEFNILKLGELNLRGELLISEMQNVANPFDALAAKFKYKTNLVKLELKWSENHDGSSLEEDVLKNLQPSKHLKELSIENYGGQGFPRWLGDDSLSNVVSLKLSNCAICDKLPSFGLLPSLKNLLIVGLHQIVDIGDEFYGSCTSSFTSLEALVFEEMPQWEKWECKAVMGAFPSLRKLSIERCPKLKEHLPEQLPCLMELKIHYCEQLVASLPRAPAIQRLYLKGCRKMVIDYNPSTLKTLEIQGSCMGGSSLERIGQTISDASLESLSVYDLPNFNFPIHHCHNSLVDLSIDGSCDSLTTFPLDFFPNLKSLDLEDCRNLQMISQEHTHNHLWKLDIRCPQFESFPSEGFSAPRLEILILGGSKNLKSLPKQMGTLLPSLISLKIYYCPQVESNSSEDLPSNLKSLLLCGCSKLVTTLKGALGANTSLVDFSIYGMDVESFPDEGLLPLSLTSLDISDCPNLKKLDYKGLCHLSSLTSLHLYNCPSIQCLPEEGLPKCISTLRIGYNCLLLKQRCQKPNGEDWEKIAHIQNLEI